MSDNQKEPQYKLRWPEDLRDKVMGSAKEQNRSINAEIIARLEQSFEKNIPSTLVSEYMKAVDQRNETIRKQLELSNLLIRTLAEKLPDDDPSKIRMLELVSQLD